MSLTDLPAGWAFPPGSRKAHFFPANDATSLCRRWGFQLTAAARDTENVDQPSKDDCAACRRALNASSAQ